VLVRNIPGSKCVAGLTILDHELYVVRSQSADIEVYQVGTTLQPVRRLSVERLRQPTDIVSSQTATVVFVADAVGYIIVVDSAGNVYSRLQVRTHTKRTYSLSHGRRLSEALSANAPSYNKTSVYFSVAAKKLD